jgi:hypothetical protein
MCINTKITKRGETQTWDGEEEDTQVPGQEEAPSATCRRGKDPVGCTAEVPAGTYTHPTVGYP